MKILVVEDEESIRSVLCEVLESMGHETFAAENTEKASMLLPLVKPRLILLDLLMNGSIATPFIEVAKSLMKDTPPTIIVLSAMNKAENIADLNGVGFLRKPFDLEELQGMIRETEAQERKNVRPIARKDHGKSDGVVHPQ